MPTPPAPRPWVPAPLAAALQARAEHYQALSPDELEAALAAALSAHERFMDRECLSLYAGTNIMNPRAARWLASTVGSRPSLGYPGDKYETGLAHAEQLEIMAVELIRELFHCRYVEFRVGSGSLANLYAFMATTRPGDRILAFPAAAAGHVTHHREGAAGLYGLEVHPVPFDAARLAVDLSALREQAWALKPRLIVVAGSLCLFPYDVGAVRAIADEVGAYVLYDAAHMSGLIAGGRFQQPLAEGAHLMTTSTYKSFGGPPAGLVLTDDPGLAQRLDLIAYPGLTANFDLGKTAALIVAALDLKEYGPAYAAACIANAQALAEALAARGVPVHGAAGRGFTASHHVALPAYRWGGGTRASRQLEPANLLASGIGLPLPEIARDFNAVRLGTQEITRWGLTPAEMPAVAELMARVLVRGEAPKQVRPDVVALRRGFQTLHYVRA
ncbi:MAG: aminotransferase class I/II-fold pyridoxal phosphate-dependent enzyme [Anaerolineales bacterium]|nr:aminotransferase class I/II-fold pyridoxal phosphate-dependent enzyme [Anaerolineales bacterium]